MIIFSTEDQLALVADASRAPSAHNTQPARWRFEEARVRLFEELSRRLTIADPENRDGRISLGAAFEGMSLALSRKGFCFVAEDHAPGAEHLERPPSRSHGTERELIVSATIQPADGALDPLAQWVPNRRTWRGEFARPTAEESVRLRSQLEGSSDTRSTFEVEAISDVARLHDRCAWSYLKHSEYHSELYDWIRFSARDAGWSRDGLSSDCMDVSAIERRLMRWVFHPRMFNLLKRLGLGPALSTEAAAVRSATAVVVLHCPAEQGPFDSGRRLYRFWLELTAMGFHACPMSATADSELGRGELRHLDLLPTGREPINVFRVGPLRREAPESRRLPPRELLA